MNKIIVVEGLDNSGKNTWAERNHPTATIVDFPIRDGKYGAEICKFLRGEIPYSQEVEEWFLENRLEWYTSVGADPTKDTVLVRSGISYLVYKWYRTGILPTPEEFSRERKLLEGTTIVFLNTEFENPGKEEICDSLPQDEKKRLKLLFTKVIADLLEVHP